MSTHAPQPLIGAISESVRIAVIAARFNEHIVGELLAGCTKRLEELGVLESSILVHRVPGAFELPLAAKLVGITDQFDAIICLGCVIRGDTPHFDYVAGECARGIQQVAIEQAIPVIFGVLTTNTEEQAVDRIGGKHGHAGERAAEAAIEMILLAETLKNSAV